MDLLGGADEDDVAVRQMVLPLQLPQQNRMAVCGFPPKNILQCAAEGVFPDDADLQWRAGGQGLRTPLHESREVQQIRRLHLILAGDRLPFGIRRQQGQSEDDEEALPQKRHVTFAFTVRRIGTASALSNSEWLLWNRFWPEIASVTRSTGRQETCESSLR